MRVWGGVSPAVGLSAPVRRGVKWPLDLWRFRRLIDRLRLVLPLLASLPFLGFTELGGVDGIEIKARDRARARVRVIPRVRVLRGANVPKRVEVENLLGPLELQRRRDVAGIHGGEGGDELKNR